MASPTQERKSKITKTHTQQSEVILRYVRQYWLDAGFSPSLREIARYLGHSKSTTYYRLLEMRGQGEILFEDDIMRSYRIPGQKVIFEEAAGHAE